MLNATFRTGTAYWKYYQFKDAAEQIAIFGGKTDTAQLHSQVMDKAGKLEVPIAWDEVEVEREEGRTTIEARYLEAVELFPRFSRNLSFAFSVEGVLTSDTRFDKTF